MSDDYTTPVRNSPSPPCSLTHLPSRRVRKSPTAPSSTNQSFRMAFKRNLTLGRSPSSLLLPQLSQSPPPRKRIPTKTRALWQLLSLVPEQILVPLTERVINSLMKEQTFPRLPPKSLQTILKLSSLPFCQNSFASLSHASALQPELTTSRKPVPASR